MMNDLVFVVFSISIAVFLLGMIVMLPNILFSPNTLSNVEKVVGVKQDKQIRKGTIKAEPLKRKRYEDLDI